MQSLGRICVTDLILGQPEPHSAPAGAGTQRVYRMLAGRRARASYMRACRAGVQGAHRSASVAAPLLVGSAPYAGDAVEAEEVRGVQPDDG